MTVVASKRKRRPRHARDQPVKVATSDKAAASFVRKCLDHLVQEGFAVDVELTPDIVFVDKVPQDALALTMWSEDFPEISTICVLEGLPDETLRRVLAHEVIHCVQYVQVGTRKGGGLGSGHGRDFEEMAACLNDELGDDFVTATYDDSYVRP